MIRNHLNSSWRADLKSHNEITRKQAKFIVGMSCDLVLCSLPYKAADTAPLQPKQTIMKFIRQSPDIIGET
jgi:hypothetical protein